MMMDGQTSRLRGVVNTFQYRYLYNSAFIYRMELRRASKCRASLRRRLASSAALCRQACDCGQYVCKGTRVAQRGGSSEVVMRSAPPMIMSSTTAMYNPSHLLSHGIRNSYGYAMSVLMKQMKRSAHRACYGLTPLLTMWTTGHHLVDGVRWM